MAFKEEFEDSGRRLFRWRSYWPLFVLAIVLIDMGHTIYFDHDYTQNLSWETFCLVVCLSGLILRVLVTGYVPEGTSGRNTLEQKAESLNTTGFYSLVRHPLYLGNFLIWLGISLFMNHLLLSLLCMILFWFHYERIILAEEEFLRRKFGREFEVWASCTPCFIPNLEKWTPSTLQFSPKKAMKDEYSGLFAIVLTFVFLETFRNWMMLGIFRLDWPWEIFFLVGLFAYLTLRAMKKRGLLETDR